MSEYLTEEKKFLDAVEQVEQDSYMPSFPEEAKKFMVGCAKQGISKLTIQLSKNARFATREFLDSFLALSNFATGENRHRMYMSFSNYYTPQFRASFNVFSSDNYKQMLHALAQNPGFPEAIYFDVLRLTEPQERLYSVDNKFMNKFRSSLILTDAALPAIKQFMEEKDSIPFVQNPISSDLVAEVYKNAVLAGNVNTSFASRIIQEKMLTVDETIQYIDLEPLSHASMVMRHNGFQIDPKILLHILNTGQMSRAALNTVLEMDFPDSTHTYFKEQGQDLKALLLSNIERFLRTVTLTSTTLTKIYHPAFESFSNRPELLGELFFVASEVGLPVDGTKLVDNVYFMKHVNDKLGETLQQDTSLLPSDWVLKMWGMVRQNVQV